MSEESLKKRGSKHGFSQLARFWRREGRRYCAVALCASLIAGNIGYMAVAASDEPDYKFELDRVALYEALQQAVADGNTVDGDFEFAGMEADTYEISMAADGSLYELTPEIDDNNGSLYLRVFARLDENIDLVDDVFDEIGNGTTSVYEIDGSEAFYFLLTNTSDKEQTAIISVGEKETEVISVIPHSAVEMPEPEGKAAVHSLNSNTVQAGAETAGDAGPGVTDAEKAGETGSGSITAGNHSGSSGNGGGGGSSGTTSVENPTEVPETETETSVENGMEAATTETEAEGKVESTEAETKEPEIEIPETGTPGKESEADVPQESDSSAGSEDHAEKETDAPEVESPGKGNDVEIEIENGDSAGDSNITEESDVFVVEDEKFGSLENDTDSNSNAADDSDDDSGNGSGNTADPGTDDSTDENSQNESSDTSDGGNAESADAAMISWHKTYRVASGKASPSNATPSDADEEEELATDSNATDSDAMKDVLDGTVLDAVRMGEDSTVLFMTTAEELKISNELEKFASPSNAGHLYEASLDTGLMVQVYANEGAFEEDVELSVKELKEDDEETAEDYQAAKDALDAENTEYTGMIALDISFLNDAGDEVEPKNGNVQVCIEMDKAVLPDDVIEETLSVKHLEENWLGNIKKVHTVADNADAEMANVDVNAEDAVVTAEFEVESFSYFVITYSNNDWWKNKNVYFYYENGTQITSGTTDFLGTKTLDPNRWYKVSDLAKVYMEGVSVSESDYLYANLGNSFSTVNQKIVWVRYTNNSWYYSNTTDTNEPSGNGSSINYNNIYLIFKAPSIPTVETVDSISKGISIKAFNYSNAINTNKYFRFVENGTSDGNNPPTINGDYINQWTGNGGGALQNILEPKLSSAGYPVLSKDLGYGIKTPSEDERSLAYLFNDKALEGKRIAKASDGSTILNHLFLKSKYDDTGYYSYDSSENYATLIDGSGEIQNNDFVVYENASDSPHFMPFNDINSDPSSQDFHFGMEIAFSFIQPKKGQFTREDGKDPEKMIFEFNGDDDLWVFIDDVLVLDIGGIHLATGGSIDFSTGKILVNGKTQASLGEKLKTYGVPDDKLEINTETGVSTLKDFTSHNVKIYYLERGKGESNCKIKFNIPTVPDGTIYVGKEITKETNVQQYIDSTFHFKLQIAKWDADTRKYQEYEDYKGEYTVYSGQIGDIEGSEKVPDAEGNTARKTENGEFTLQRNQFAVFEEGISDADRYRVVEYEPDAVADIKDLYDVVISGTTATDLSIKDGSGSEHKGLGLEDLPVGSNHAALFTNECKADNLYNLEITKVLESITGEPLDSSHANDTDFIFDVKLGEELYKGGYRVYELILNDDSNKVLTEVASYTENDGIKLRAGQTAVINGIVNGNSFEVTERTEKLSQYATPLFKCENAVEVKPKNPAEGGIAGKIPLSVGDEKVTRVTAVNRMKTGSLTINKTVKSILGDSGAKFDFKLQLYKVEGGATEYYTETISGRKNSDQGNTEIACLNNSYAFKLGNDESIVVDIPFGYEYKIVETDPGAEKYDTYITVGTKEEVYSSGKMTKGTFTSPISVTFKNVRKITVDTGILLDSMPYVLILGAVAAGIAFYFIRKKKDDEDDLD